MARSKMVKEVIRDMFIPQVYATASANSPIPNRQFDSMKIDLLLDKDYTNKILHTVRISKTNGILIALKHFSLFGKKRSVIEFLSICKAFKSTFSITTTCPEDVKSLLERYSKELGLDIEKTGVLQ